MRNRVGNEISYDYDRRFDVLYVSFGAPRESYCEEPEEGFLIRHNLIDGSFAGVTVIEFMRRCQEGTLPKIPLPVDIDFAGIARRLRGTSETT
ncbi:MAG: hypothetical protein QME82_09165 [Bacillota bacterium]|nr:hypothetical protein [Bacillota bacterium]